MDAKICKKCGGEKSLSGKTSLRYVCKACRRKYQLVWEKENVTSQIEKRKQYTINNREKARKYYLYHKDHYLFINGVNKKINAEKINKRRRTWRAENKEISNEIERLSAAKRVDRYKEKAKVSRKTRFAIASGKLVKGECSYPNGKCVGRIEGHHKDYSKPLDVTWVCQKHHVLFDKIRRLIDKKLTLITI